MSSQPGGAATEGINQDEEDVERGLGRVLRMSFGRCATDYRPVARELTFGDLIAEFSTPDPTRGKLMSAEYHALDKEVPAQKHIRNREKDGRYFVPCTFKSGYRSNDDIEQFCGIALDFDDANITAADLRQRLRGYTYAAYTHTARCQQTCGGACLSPTLNQSRPTFTALRFSISNICSTGQLIRTVRRLASFRTRHRVPEMGCVKSLSHFPSAVARSDLTQPPPREAD